MEVFVLVNLFHSFELSLIIIKKISFITPLSKFSLLCYSLSIIAKVVYFAVADKIKT